MPKCNEPSDWAIVAATTDVNNVLVDQFFEAFMLLRINARLWELDLVEEAMEQAR